MREYNIRHTEDAELVSRINKKFASKIFPSAQLSVLREMAVKAALIQQTAEPVLKKPAILLFAADHGYLEDLPGQSATDFNYQNVLHYLNGGSVSNLYARYYGVQLRIVDVGINHRFERMLSFWLNQGVKLYNRKIGLGTQNFHHGPAMTTAECHKAIELGAEVVRREKRNACSCIGLSEIAAGNSLSVYALLLALTEKEEWHGALREQLSDEELQLTGRALRKHPKTHDVITLLSLYGGFEIAAMCGAIWQAAENHQHILLDSRAGLLAAFIASRQHPACLEYCNLSTQPHNALDQMLSEKLRIRAIQHIAWSAGEGSSFPLAIEILRCSLIYLDDSASRDETDLPERPVF